MEVADYLVAFLAAKGVRHVFGYPGGALVPLLEAIERHPQIEWVLMRHESSAAFAACAQAKLNGRLAVCAATAGPGALNFLCGVVDAHLDRAPVLTLTGQVPSSQKGHVGFQDLDQASLCRSILRRSESTSNPVQLASLLRNLIGHAEQHRETVHLAVPVDVLSTELDKSDDCTILTPSSFHTRRR